MKQPYGIFSDPHCHKWSAFAHTLPSGVNSRLQATLDEIRRCADETRKAGGHLLVCAGDMFHVRGNISPEVLNPVMKLIRKLEEEGFVILIIAGNHDLESHESNNLSSAITALKGIGVIAVNEPFVFNQMTLVPWVPDIKKLKETLKGAAVKGDDLIIHAPIDGVIKGLPDHGLTADWLGGLGFDRVFSGHYHNFKDFDNGVYSIGSTTHLTWSDVGSDAGFLVVHEDRVERFESNAPKFVDLTDDIDPNDVPALVKDNYVRAKVSTSKSVEINKMRDWLTDDCGAKGVIIQSVKAPTKERSGAVTHSVKAGASIEVSIAEYVKSQSFDNADKVQIECQKILAEAGV